MTGNIPQIDLGTINVYPDPDPVAAGAGGGQGFGPADTFKLAMGGALDLKSMPDRVAPLDQLSSERISHYANNGPTNPPSTAALDSPMPDVPTVQMPGDMRYEYARQLMNGDVSGPQDFTEQTAAAAWQNVKWDHDDANWDDHSAQVTNAAKALAQDAPDHNELNTTAAYLAQNEFGQVTPEAVTGIKGNLLDAWAQNPGKSLADVMQTANTDPDFASRLATPPPPPLVHFPTMEELEVKGRDAVQDPLGNMTTAPMGGLVKALGDTFLQLAGGFKPDDYMKAAAHITGADVKSFYDVDLKPGEKLSEPAERDNPEDMFSPEENLARNKQWSRPGEYDTKLSPQDEAEFRQWLKDKKVPFEPDEANQDYDMRGFWKAQKAGDKLAKSDIDPNDNRIHYPDYWKTPYAATFSAQSQWATKNAPDWKGDKYTLPNGHVIYDDETGRWNGMPGEKHSEAVGKPIAENKAEPPTVQDVAKFVANHLLNGPPAEAQGALGAGPSYGALIRSAWRGEDLNTARRTTTERGTAAGRIRKNVGQATWEKAMAKASLDGFHKVVQPLVPGYLNWLKEFQEWNKQVAAQRDAWIAGGGDPAKFSTESVIRNGPEISLKKVTENEAGVSYEVLHKGDTVGRMLIKKSENGKEAYLGNVYAGKEPMTTTDFFSGSRTNSLGPSFIRAAMRQFFRDNPAVERITGERMSGARYGQAASGRGSVEMTVNRPNSLGAPPEFPPGKPQTYHPIQTLFDHIENRPGGARLDPKSPLLPLADQIKDLMEERRAGLEADVSDTMGFWEDYFPHNWLDPRINVDRAFAKEYGSGRQGNGYHLRERQLPTIFDGIQRGLTPRFPNPIEATLHYIQAVDDFRAAERIRGQGLDYDGLYYARDGSNLLGPTDAPLSGRSATRLRVYNDADGKAHAYQETLYAPRGWAQIYNNWIGRGIYDWKGGVGEYAGSLYDKLNKAKNASLGLAFGLSGFHPVVIMKQTAGAHWGEIGADVARGDVGRALAHFGMGLPTGVGTVMAARRGAQFNKAYMDRPGATPTDLKLAKIYRDAGGAAASAGRGEPYFASGARNLFTSWARAGSWGIENPLGRALAAPAGMATELAKSTASGLAGAVRRAPGEGLGRQVSFAVPRMLGALTESFGRVTDTIMGPLFDKLIPAVKQGVWADHMEGWIKAHPTATGDEIVAHGRQTMDRIDNTHGEMNMENIFWPRTAKQLANLATVSIGWEFGSWRAAGKTVEDLSTKEGGARFGQNATSLMGYITAMATFNAAYQFFKTGTTPLQTGVSNFVMPQTVKNDPMSVVQTPGEEKEAVRIYGLMKAAAGDPVKLARLPFDYLGGKAQPMLRDIEAFIGSHNTKEFLKKALENHQPAGMWANSPNANLTPLETQMGVHSAPNSITGYKPPHASGGSIKSPPIPGRAPAPRQERSETPRSRSRRERE